MKFLTRSLIGIFLLALTAGLLALAGGQIYWAMQQAQSDEGFRRPAQEREFAVNVATLYPVSVAPVITSYGTVKSWRTLELRAAIGGELVELSPEFRDGGQVSIGDLLFKIDPADAASAVELANISLAEADAELTDATTALELVKAELDVAERQLVLRQQAAARQLDLKSRGIGTDAEVENTALAVISAEQAIIGQQQALATAVTRIARAEIAMNRQRIALADATRALQATEVYAPFDGVLGSVTAILGGQVSGNEILGQLIDPMALEVAFRVSNSQFARLLDGDGRLQRLPIVAILNLNDLPFRLEGTLERAGAEVGEGQTGRLLYARLDDSAADILRPGDFLTVEITELPLTNVAVVPATAVASNGAMLLIGAEDRLEETFVTILRHQADSLIISDMPIGRVYVTALTPQIGVGIKVKPLRDGVAEEAAEPEVIALDEARRAKLVAFIEGNDRMPADVKERILGQLREPEVPKEVVDRLESRMGG